MVLTRIDRVEELFRLLREAAWQESATKDAADRELQLRQVLDRKIEEVCMRLDVPRTAVHFIENYHSGVLDLEQEVRNISVDFHALKILSQCCSHADAFIARAMQDLRPVNLLSGRNSDAFFKGYSMPLHAFACLLRPIPASFLSFDRQPTCVVQ